jgi:alditol oxidase
VPVGLRNWAGNYAYGARVLHRPRTVDELRRIVAGAPNLHVIGARHSFTGIGDADEIVSLEGLPAAVALGDGTVTCAGHVRYGELAGALNARGLALHNLASLPHISVAGATATATHGSGDGNGNLATAVAALELVTSDGEVVHAERGDPDFAGMVVHLGALGAVTRVTLDVEPAYAIAQHVFEDVAWDALPDALGAAYSVSAFTRWGDAVEMVWVKRRLDEPVPELPGRPARTEHHPIPGLDATGCTAQRGVPGAWSDRLPHFRLEFTPSHGEEIQSEYFVDRDRASEAIAAMRAAGPSVRGVLQVSELRTMAADELWLSPQHRRPTLGVHFTWKRDPPAVERALAEVEAALLPLGATPHWGKFFLTPPRPERLGDFRALAGRLDPRHAFRSRWLADNVGL